MSENVIKGFPTRDGTARYDFGSLANVPGPLKEMPSAAVGQFLKVTAVDANGKIAAVEAVNAPSSGASLSVMDYGAKGDGATDDTKAFQDALAENRVVFVPGGEYIISDTLLIRANCCLELSQDTVLKFTQTDKNCITLLRLAHLKGHHATIFVPYTFGAKVINADTAEDEAVLNQDDLVNSNTTAVPPFKKWDPQWKMSRYVTDINICKPNSSGFHYSDDGTCYGTAVYMGCSEGVADYMWGVSMSGLRIAGGFTYGIHMVNEGETWNHDARIEAVIDSCETAVCLDNCHYTRLAVTIQPRPAADKTAYAKHGIKLVNSKGIDLSSSRVWDWNENNTLWTNGGEYQHIAMYGQCRGLILDDFFYHEMPSYDIRSLIYTDTASNLEQMTILQEPITRWFKPVDGVPYFSDGFSTEKIITQSDMDGYFDVDAVKNFTDALETAIGTDGKVYEGVGYKIGRRMETDGTEFDSPYYVLTGFIPCKKGSTIYTNHMSMAKGDEHCRVQFFDASFNPVTLINRGNLLNNGNTYTATYTEMENGFKLEVSGNVVHDTTAYVRFVIYKQAWGTYPMVSIDNEIKYTVEGYLADGVKVKAANVIGMPEGGGSADIEEALSRYFEVDTVKNYTDVLASATDTDGVTVFNGIGYKTGVRFADWGKGSSLYNSAQYMTTGFMEVPQGATVNCKDLKFANVDMSYSCIAFYDANREWAAHIGIGNIAGNKAPDYTTDYAETDDGCSFKISAGATLTNKGYKYLRICFPMDGVGASPAIAINQVISEEEYGFLADEVKVKAENVIGSPVLTSPNGARFMLSVADDGTISATPTT